MKKLYILSALLLFTFSQLNAQYFWQVDAITNITGAGTYDQNETPTNVMLRLSQCPGGISQPHNLTNYDLEWFVNSTNSNTGGTPVSSFNTSTTVSFDPTITFLPPTDVAGTFYYYAEISNPSMSTCGFLAPLRSGTVEIVINTVLGINDFSDEKISINLYPNPSLNDIQVSGLTKTENYIIYNIIGAKVREGAIAPNERMNIQNLRAGMYFFKMENRNPIKFIKE
ncbi:MAG: T9SS type A sorting domain-containing protein [Flavobacteriaceae bacterium]|nr:T9SS type A sorting domain-containing protein [Flavobacteriaceae bacterium]